MWILSYFKYRFDSEVNIDDVIRAPEKSGHGRAGHKCVDMRWYKW